MTFSKNHLPSDAVEVSAPSGISPEMEIVQMAMGGFVTRALYALAELGIADYFENETVSAEDIARATGVSAPFLYRLLRNMTGFGLFTEDESHRFSLTTKGASLQSGFIRSSVRTLAGPTVWRALDEVVYAIKSGESCAQKTLRKPIFEYLRQNPDEMHLFNESMTAIHRDEPAAIVKNYDFSGIGRLMDIGGGTGGLLAEILREYPQMDGVLYELPEVANDARQNLEARGLSTRCEVIEGNFFDSFPPGGDAYILSHVIHDWDEESCLKILKNCHTAMQNKSRLLIIEQVIPSDDGFHPAKILDLLMLTMMTGQERTREEYAELLRKADFQLERTIATPSAASVLEAFPR